MTTIINASSTNGLVQTADGSGVIKLQSDGKTTNALAWVNFNGTTSPGTIRAQYNVSSVTKNGTGDYTVNYTNALSDGNYCAVPGGSLVALSGSSGSSRCIDTGNYTTTNFRVSTFVSNTAALTDFDLICIAIFGN